MHVIFDWDGTLARKDVAEEASMRRGDSLGVAMDKEWMREAQKTHAHYKVNKDAIEKYTGITDEKLKTIMMTNLFQLHYLAVVNEWKDKVFFEGIKDMLYTLRDEGYKISIASTIREDIIKPSLNVLGVEKYFDSVHGNNASLDYSKNDLVGMAVKNNGKAAYMVGDREEDMVGGRSVGAKNIFVTWGQGELNDKSLADYVVNSTEELVSILKNER